MSIPRFPNGFEEYPFVEASREKHLERKNFCKYPKEAEDLINMLDEYDDDFDYDLMDEYEEQYDSFIPKELRESRRIRGEDQFP
jgi:hypothetical protein